MRRLPAEVLEEVGVLEIIISVNYAVFTTEIYHTLILIPFAISFLIIPSGSLFFIIFGSEKAWGVYYIIACVCQFVVTPTHFPFLKHIYIIQINDRLLHY